MTKPGSAAGWPYRKRPKRKVNGFDVFIFVFCVTFAFICFYPLWYVILVSVMPMSEYAKRPIPILPRGTLDFQYYRIMFSNEHFYRSVMVSGAKTVLGTFLAVMATSMMAYGVSKRHVPGMRMVNFMVIMTMYFSGGLMPTYFLYRDIGILKTFWAMVIPMILNVTYYILMRNYFLHELPWELEEAALLDGANQVTAFFRVVVPTSAPMIAAITLFIAVFHWNDWYSYNTYISSVPQLRPLSNMLRDVLKNQNFLQNISLQAEATVGFTPPPMQLRMTTIVLATLPILIVYPFLQKYFTKGLMLGAVKG